MAATRLRRSAGDGGSSIALSLVRLASAYQRAFSRPWSCEFTSGDWGGAVVTPDREFPGLGSVSYWGWTEWTPAGYVVNNFDVQAGDTASVLVCAPQTNHGFVVRGNSRTNQAVSVGLNPEAGETANGPSAEWIIEAITPLTPAFTPLTIFGCVAGDHDSPYGVTGATLLDLPDPQGTDEVKTTIVSPSSVLIQWEAFQ